MRLSFFSTEEDGYLTMGETLAAAWAKAIEEPESLTTTEMVQLEGYLQNVWTQINRWDYLYQEGLYEVSGESNIVWAAKQIFANTFARAWWQEKRKDVADSGLDHLRIAMDQAIGAHDDNTQAHKFENILRTIANVQSGDSAHGREGLARERRNIPWRTARYSKIQKPASWPQLRRS
jgi:hypothetical protein